MSEVVQLIDDITVEMQITELVLRGFMYTSRDFTALDRYEYAALQQWRRLESTVQQAVNLLEVQND